MPVKKRGAQAGNHNALKHGFYSRHFKQGEIQELASIREGLSDEISLMKILIQRVFDAADEEQSSLEMWSKTLSILGLASTRLATLIRIQEDIKDSSESELVSALNQALQEISSEMKGEHDIPQPRLF